MGASLLYLEECDTPMYVGVSSSGRSGWPGARVLVPASSAGSAELIVQALEEYVRRPSAVLDTARTR
jgi:hypothetical protein